MRLTVHRREDQAIEERTQPLGDETTGEVGRITHHRHDVVVLEQGESGAVRIQPGNRRYAQARHEVLRENGRFLAHFAIHRVQIDVGATVIARDIGEDLFQIALGRGGHGHLLSYCALSECMA
ncbi:hypothetical protein D9M71_360880 [compost metagenome]